MKSDDQSELMTGIIYAELIKGVGIIDYDIVNRVRFQYANKIIVHKNTKQKYYFTFGSGQPHEGCYVIIESDSWNGARSIMIDKFGLKWGFQYTESSWILNPLCTRDEMICTRYHITKPTPQNEVFDLKLLKL